MRCPWKQIKTTDKIFEDGEHTKEVTEFGVCDMKLCPYFGLDNKGGWCQRVAKEVGYCRYQEVK